MRVLELKCKRKMHLQSLYMFYRGYYLGKKKVPVTTPFSWNFMLDTYGGVIVFFFFFLGDIYRFLYKIQYKLFKSKM